METECKMRELLVKDGGMLYFYYNNLMTFTILGGLSF